MLLQFSRLRSWLQSLERVPYGHEFYEPKSFLVKAVNTIDNRPFRVSADKIDTSRWPYRHIPQLPTMASTPRYGQVEILQVEKTRDLMRFYQHVMTTELVEIRCRDVWHIVMAWHDYSGRHHRQPPASSPRNQGPTQFPRRFLVWHQPPVGYRGFTGLWPPHCCQEAVAKEWRAHTIARSFPLWRSTSASRWRQRQKEDRQGVGLERRAYSLCHGACADA